MWIMTAGMQQALPSRIHFRVSKDKVIEFLLWSWALPCLTGASAVLKTISELYDFSKHDQCYHNHG